MLRLGIGLLCKSIFGSGHLRDSAKFVAETVKENFENAAYFTSDKLKFEFPKTNPCWTQYVIGLAKDQGGFYQVNTHRTMSPMLEGYIPIINQALTFFNPSNPDLFDSDPFIIVVIKNSVVGEGKTSVVPHLHQDQGLGGDIDVDGKIFDGVMFANSIDASCYIVPAIMEGPEEEWENFKEELKDKLVYMKANQFYWIGDKTLHQAVPMKQATYRSLISILLGAYLLPREILSSIRRY
jgi:hypothetical protein